MIKTKVLFVCMGNICRSPSAQGVFEKLVEENKLKSNFYIDSAGTHSYHVGNHPDHRSIKAAYNRGIDIAQQQSRQLISTDFEKFDLIIAMDDENYNNIKSCCPFKYQYKITKMKRFCLNNSFSEVPDPYYGGVKGFEKVLDILEESCSGLLENLQTTHSN